MAKTLVILILLFDGTLIQERLNFTRPMEVHECLMFAADHRETISKYVDTKGWVLNDGRGTIKGFICELFDTAFIPTNNLITVDVE